MIDHLNIVVSDLEVSARFYEALLGLKRGFAAMLEGAWIEAITGLKNVRAECLFLEAENGSTRLELLQYLSPEGEAIKLNSCPATLGLRHVAFVVEDFEALIERLKSAGVPMVGEPVEVPFQVGNMGRKRLCYFLDPDGTLLEAAAYDSDSATP